MDCFMLSGARVRVRTYVQALARSRCDLLKKRRRSSRTAHARGIKLLDLGGSINSRIPIEEDAENRTTDEMMHTDTADASRRINASKPIKNYGRIKQAACMHDASRRY
jgi:hypothetical protein